MMSKVVTFGEVMLRLSAPGHERLGQSASFNVCFGGGEANVAVSLANYGIEADFITRLPENDIADKCIRELKGFGVGTSNILRGGGRIGIYYLETGASARPSKVVYDRSHSSFAEIKPGMVDWNQVLKGADWFHWTGITPAVSQGAAEACLEAIQTANKLGVNVSCDLNYRKKLWNYGKTAAEVMPALMQGCDLILCNEEDAQMVFGLSPDKPGDLTPQAYASVAQELIRMFPRCKKVAFTLRGSINASHNTWGGALWNGSRMLGTPRYDVTHIVDRVGAGDSFMGGLLYGLLEYGDDQKALDFAAAASCLKHTIPGDYNRVNAAEVEALMGGNANGRVQR